MGKEIVNQVQEAQRVPYRINPRRNTLRHILIKLTEIKHTERLLKAAREKQHTRENPCDKQRIIYQKLCRPEEYGGIYLKYWKKKIYNQDYCNPARLSLKINGEIKSFSDKQKLREFSNTKPALQQMLMGFI